MIEEYIKQAQSMINISTGNSPAYSFGDKILIRYSMPNKYGLARKNEEEIAKIVNAKHEKGVRTPLHLEIKRTKNFDFNYCWVLQSKAPGKCMLDYIEKSPMFQLQNQKYFLDAPFEHYTQCVKDLAELMYMDVDLHPKNVFYKGGPEGGFTFIDLSIANDTPFNPDSIKDVLWIYRHLSFITKATTIPSYNSKATPEDFAKTKELEKAIKAKIFLAMESAIPNFKQFRNWVLRFYSEEELTYFKTHGIEVGSLNLTEEDYQKFDEYVQIIINNCIAKIASGKCDLGQVETNEIRLAISDMGLRPAWVYHHANLAKDPSNYTDQWEYEKNLNYGLDKYVKTLFYEELAKVAEENNNPYLLEALEIVNKDKNFNHRR